MKKHWLNHLFEFKTTSMDTLIHFLWIIGGFVALYYGAEFLVKGASDIALKFGISALVVGLTVVAFGTSAPELLVCLEANAKGMADQASALKGYGRSGVPAVQPDAAALSGKGISPCCRYHR